MSVPEAVEIVASRNGTPHEDDWELAEAATVLLLALLSPPVRSEN